MTNQDNNNAIKSPTGGFNFNKWLFNLEPNRTIQSLNAISKVIFVFTLMFLAAYLFKLFNVNNETTKHFRLILTDTDILPLFKTDTINFSFIATYEVVKLIIIALTFFYFIKFLNSIDFMDPFANINSKGYISKVAAMSILFFMADFIATLHLSNLKDALPDMGVIHIFHFEYLFLAYFINVFAIIFKRGVDLKNEIDLVI